MSSTDTYKVNRYTLDKELIANGTLTVIDEGQKTKLIYKDAEVEVQASALHHPITALENLRKELEVKHNSLLGINGCRMDTSRQTSSSFGSYLVEDGLKATEDVHMFEPTTEVGKLCTVEQHEAAYEKWLDSVMPKS
jgi:hypothetical protein